jgi:hypothetical protein
MDSDLYGVLHLVSNLSFLSVPNSIPVVRVIGNG